MRFMTPLVLALLSAPALAQSGAKLAAPAAPTVPAPRPIPRATFISDMDKTFQEIDTNHDGVLSAEELRASQLRAAQARAALEAQKLFRELDTDHNGVLSPAEFAKIITIDPAKLPPSPYAAFDTNRDGKVSLIEYRTGTQANFDTLDKDRDGVVSVEEMKAAGVIPGGPAPQHR